MKTITLNQIGHKIPIKILVHNIKLFYPLTYKTNDTVTVVEFMDGTERHFIESTKEVEGLING